MNTQSSPSPEVTKEKTIASLLDKAVRTHVPIRRTFLQQGSRLQPSEGPLAKIVKHHDERALDLYLLFRAGAVKAPYRVNLSGRTWARMLGLSGPAGVAAVSRAWGRLEQLHLLERHRFGRTASVTALREDGHGRPYLHPAEADKEPYFQLPVAYWKEGWDAQLNLAGKTMLLIALSLQDWFYLPMERAKTWYGISGDTADRGLRKLQGLGLIERRRELKLAPLSPLGYTFETFYRLKPPFGPRRVQPTQARPPSPVAAAPKPRTRRAKEVLVKAG